MNGKLRLGEHPAVVVVDLSCGFTDPSSPVGSDLSDVVAATRTLLDHAREVEVPIVFTSIAFHPHDHERLVWLQKMPGLGVLQAGDPAVELDPGLGRLAHEPIVFKKGASAIAGTELPSLLVSHGVDTVVVCGATTSGCVRATAVDLMQLSYPVLVPRECVGDRAVEPHEANLFDLQEKYAEVSSLDTAVRYLRHELSAVR